MLTNNSQDKFYDDYNYSVLLTKKENIYMERGAREEGGEVGAGKGKVYLSYQHTNILILFCK